MGLVGHIEDIAVAKDQQGKKLGLSIIQALDHVAEKVGCYKVSICFLLLWLDSLPDLEAMRRELSREENGNGKDEGEGSANT